jgi:hypothetical protein
MANWSAAPNAPPTGEWVIRPKESLRPDGLGDERSRLGAGLSAAKSISTLLVHVMLTVFCGIL